MNALISTLPILLLFVLMLGFKVSGWKSALATLLVTAAMGLWIAPALGIMPSAQSADHPAATVWWAFAEGTLKAVFPILLIILTAIYSYNVLVASKAIEVIKAQFTSFTDDKGVLVLMMVWGFGGLLEGMAGFGTAVAIPAAILIGLGFKPMFSALVALLGNTVATGFGAVGVPVTTLCNEVTPGGAAAARTICEISTFSVIQLSALFVLVPFAILMLTDRQAWMKNICLSVWTGAVSLAVQLVCAAFLGAETPAILGSIAAIAAIVAYNSLFVKRPAAPRPDRGHTAGEILRAWSVYLLVLALILVTGPVFPAFNSFLKSHLVTVLELPAVGGVFRFSWLSNAALMLLLGSMAGGAIQGLGWRQLANVLAATIVNLRFTAITIVSLIALSSIMNHTGMIAALAGGLVAVTGTLYPLFAPLIGAVGTFVTGSDTSSNILFGKLQANVASQLGLEDQMGVGGFTGSETDWLAAANTSGATGGKMISPQSVAIATAACNMKGADDAILRKALPYALAYILICGLVVWLGLNA